MQLCIPVFQEKFYDIIYKNRLTFSYTAFMIIEQKQIYHTSCHICFRKLSATATLWTPR